MTDRRKFLQLIASACAVAVCPKILIPAEAVVEPVIMYTAAPLLTPQLLTLVEWDALLTRVQERHFREMHLQTQTKRVAWVADAVFSTKPLGGG